MSSEVRARNADGSIKLCLVDGIEIDDHRRCRACTVLAGPGHDLGATLVRGLCRSCLEESNGLRVGHARVPNYGGPWMAGEFHGTKNFVWKF